MRGEEVNKIGEYLKEVRLTRGLTYHDVELATRIPARYLEAIEEGNFDRLPGKAYVIGFIRSYARFLQVDSDELVSYYKQLTGMEDEYRIPSTGETGDSDKEALAKANYHPMKRWKVGIIISFMVVLLSGGLLYYLGAMGNGTPPAEDENGLNAPDNNSGLPDVSLPDDGLSDEFPLDDGQNTDEETVEEGLTILLSAKRGPCWIGVTNSSGYEESYLNRGDEIILKDESYIKIKFGSAGAVDVYINNILQESLGKIGDVSIKEYHAED